jgi:hypothetical protein
MASAEIFGADVVVVTYITIPEITKGMEDMGEIIFLFAI